MSDTEPTSETTVRPRRRWRRFLGAAVVLGVLALAVALTIQAARPRWYPFISKPITPNDHFTYIHGMYAVLNTPVLNRPNPVNRPFALSIRLPVGWECRPKPSSGYEDGWLQVDIRRKPVTGLAQWWNQHILHLDTSKHHLDTYTVECEAATIGDTPDAFIQYWSQRYAPFRQNQPPFRCFEHPLGPALQETGSDRHGPLSEQYMDTEIAVRLTPLRERVWIDARHSRSRTDFSRTQSTWNEIVRSIRVVKK